MNSHIKRLFSRWTRSGAICVLLSSLGIAQSNDPAASVRENLYSSTMPAPPIERSTDFSEVTPGQPTRESEPPASSNSRSIIIQKSRSTSVNDQSYYRNRLEFSLEGGWLPINIPFPFDVFLGDGYTMTPRRYTLVPIIAGLRWHMDDLGGRWIFRGNWDMNFTGSVTAIPSGPETRYFSYIMGIRRNFVPRRGSIAPYFDYRLGLGNIDAAGPKGVLWSQGQDFTFTMNMGSGVRYNFSSRYSITAGLNWMHISNLYLSEPKFKNYGINVYGPLFGMDIRLVKPRRGTQ